MLLYAQPEEPEVHVLVATYRTVWWTLVVKQSSFENTQFHNSHLVLALYVILYLTSTVPTLPLV